MQKRLVFPLLVLLFLPLLAKIWTVSNYALHKVYYATVLCENKDKPIVAACCEGRCQLTKQLKSIDQPSQSSSKDKPYQFISYKFDNYIPAPISNLNFSSASTQLITQTRSPLVFSYHFFLPQPLRLPLLHPPAVA